MRWTLIGLVGLVTGFAAWASGPLFYPAPVEGIVFVGSGEWLWYELVIISFYAPFIIVVLAGTLGVFRALSLSTRRAELASLIALGRTRRSLVGDHARAGLRDGAIASSGVVLATLGRQATVGLDGVEFVPSVAIGAVMLIVTTLISFTLAYWASAWWATRGSVREVAAGISADAGPASRVTSRSHWARLPWVWVALGLVVISLVIHFGLVSVPDSSDGFSVGTVIGAVSAIIATFAVYLLLPVALGIGGAKVAIWVVRCLAKLGARQASPGSAQALAADGLARRVPLRTAAATAIVLVMGTSVALTATNFARTDYAHMVDELEPTMYISTVDLASDPESADQREAGWAPALPFDLVREIKATPGMTVIEAGLLITDPSVGWEGDDAKGDGAHGMYVAVDPHDLDTVVTDASKRLFLADSVVTHWGRYGWPYIAPGNEPYLSLNGEQTEVAVTRADAPWTGMSRLWAEQVWGPAPTSALLLYRTGDQAVDLGLHTYEDQGFAVGSTGSFGWHSSADGVAVAAVTAPFLALAVALIIALAWSQQRLRAREQATLLALGADPVSLRLATTVESAVLTLVTAVVGVLSGALIGPTWAVTATAPLPATSLDVILWNIGRNLTLIPWGVVIGLVVGAAALAAAGALVVVRVRLEQRTPAEQLSEAVRKGVA